MVGRAVQAEIDAEWYGAPGWIFRAAIEAYLVADG